MNPKADKLKAPAHLAPATKKWWETITETFELESHHLRLLQAACESWDRLQGAREVLDRDGITYTNRFGDPCARPEVAVERDSRVAFARLCRELRLDDVPPPEAPRPAPLNR